MQELLQDIRYALRMLRRTPSFSVAAVLSLAIGIGANSTIFSVADALLFRPLPYPNSDRLVKIINVRHADPGENVGVSDADVVRWRQNGQVFDRIEATADGAEASALRGAGSPERVMLQHFTPGIFSILGVQPILGHVPQEHDADQQAFTAATISYEFWHRHFGADPGAIGRRVFLDNQEARIVAVLPKGFDLFGGPPPDVVALMGAEGIGQMADRLR